MGAGSPWPVRRTILGPRCLRREFLDDFVAAIGERVARNIARAGHPGLAEEIADVVAFLSGPESRWLKRAGIPIDGGMTAMAICGAMELPAALRGSSED